MRSVSSHSRHARIIITLIMCIGYVCCTKYDNIAVADSTPPTTNISLGELRSLVADRTLTIEQDLVIGGYVTSCDKANNFYHTFTFEDLTAGAELMAGMYDLHNLFPKGYYVTIRLKGCTLARYNGILQIGRKAKSYSNYPTDYFTSRILLEEHVTCHNSYNPVAPAPAYIKELTTDMCGTLITIGGLRLCSASYQDIWQVNQEGQWRGYNIFCDKDSNIIVVYTSEYADYALEAIPTQQVALTGILQQSKFNGKECFLIKMRDEKDCSIQH